MSIVVSELLLTGIVTNSTRSAQPKILLKHVIH